MATLVYVDYTNFHKEARHIAAVREGLAPTLDYAMDNKVFGQWACHFRHFYDFIVGDGEVKRAFLVTSGEFNVKAATEAGFETVVIPRGFRRREKRVDTTIAVQAIEDGLSQCDSAFDEFVLITGDLDQEPTVTKLRSYGYKVTVMFWGHASVVLREAADEFISLDAHWDYLTWVPKEDV